MRYNYIFTILLILLLPIICITREKSYTPSYQYKKGDVADYTLRVKGKGVGTIDDVELPYSIDVSIPLKVEVTNVTSDGLIDLKIMPRDIILNVPPTPRVTIPEGLKTVSYTITFTKYGRVVKTTGLSEFPTNSDEEVAIRLLAEVASISTLIFPEKAIKIGDTWEQEIVKEPHQPIKLNFKFEKVEKVNKLECAVIKVSNLSIPVTTLNIIPTGDYNPVRGVIEGTPTYYFSTEKGILLKASIPGKFKLYTLLTDKIGDKFRIRLLEINFEGEVVLEKK